MEKERDSDHKKNSPSQQGAISLAQKEELLANFNVEKFKNYAQYIAAQDHSINQALISVQRSVDCAETLGTP